MSEYTELLIGCGHTRDRRIQPERFQAFKARGAEREFPKRPADGWARLVTMDHNQDAKPDVYGDLEAPRWGSHFKPSANLADLFEARAGAPGVKFRESVFDEVHAYEVLEHLGWQGDAGAFYDTFNELWRILKPEGLVCATCPAADSPWAWGDPGHRRIISAESLVFLDRRQHKANILRGISSDYRALMKCDFQVCFTRATDGIHTFILEAIKPERPW